MFLTVSKSNIPDTKGRMLAEAAFIDCCSVETLPIRSFQLFRFDMSMNGAPTKAKSYCEFTP